MISSSGTLFSFSRLDEKAGTLKDGLMETMLTRGHQRERPLSTLTAPCGLATVPAGAGPLPLPADRQVGRCLVRKNATT